MSYWYDGSPDAGFTALSYVWSKCDYYQVFSNRAPIFKEGLPPAEAVKTYPNPMKLALQYNEILENGIIASRADLARHLGVSRAKITQIMNLLKLPAEIRVFIANLEDTDKRLQILTERRLRSLAQSGDNDIQINGFKELIDVIN